MPPPKKQSKSIFALHEFKFQLGVLNEMLYVPKMIHSNLQLTLNCIVANE